jgi:hypothetical protein
MFKDAAKPLASAAAICQVRISPMLFIRLESEGHTDVVSHPTSRNHVEPSKPSNPSVISRPSQQRALTADRGLFNQMKVAWLERTLIDGRRPELGSWLEESTKTDQDWGVGCRVCREAAVGHPVRWTPWLRCGIKGLCLKWSNIDRHQKSDMHCQVTNDKYHGKIGVAMGSPPMDMWRQVLDRKRKGTADSACHDVAGAEKVQRMAWCIAEALKDQEQKLLKKAVCLSIHQDAREGLLLVRYSSVDDRLTRSEGVLGMAKDYGTKSKEIHDATLGIIKDFCTKRQTTDGRRSTMAGREPAILMTDLFEHVKSRIELFDADGATDEQRAGRLLMDELPNLKLVIRDRTHAATRQRVKTCGDTANMSN